MTSDLSDVGFLERCLPSFKSGQVALLVVRSGGQAETDGTGREVVEFTPHHGWDVQPFLRGVEGLHEAHAATVVYFHFKAALQANQCLVAGAVGMVAPFLSFGHIGYPENAPHLEGESFSVREIGNRERAALVGECLPIEGVIIGSDGLLHDYILERFR